MANVASSSSELIVGSVQQQAVLDMGKELHTLYEKIRDKFMRAAQDDILARYDIGTMIHTAMSNEKKYGNDAAEKLALALDVSVSSLYVHQQVAVTWSRADLKALISRVEPESGYHLAWGHLWALSTVAKPDSRAALVEECFENVLSVRDFKHHVETMLGTRTNNPKGRPRSVPRSPSAGLATLRKLTNSLVNAQNVFDESVFDRLVEHPAEYATPAIIEQLKSAEEDQSRLELTAQNNLVRLKAALAAVEDSLQARLSEPEDDEEEEEEEEEDEEESATVGDEFLPRRRDRSVTQLAARTAHVTDVIARAKAGLLKKRTAAAMA
jgi:hypothetical protein